MACLAKHRYSQIFTGKYAVNYKNLKQLYHKYPLTDRYLSWLDEKSRYQGTMKLMVTHDKIQKFCMA
jgi:hypothetical protein